MILTKRNPHIGIGLQCLAFLALLIALVLGPQPALEVQAATIDVPCNTAQLIAAINAANGSGEPDTLNLAPGCVYTLTQVDNETEGPNGLPPISGSITVDGNEAIIERSDVAGTPEFRILYIAETGDLELNQLTIRYSSWVGGIYNDAGDLTVRDSILEGNGGSLAVHNQSGEVTLVRSIARDSRNGPALVSVNGAMTVRGSVVDGNGVGGLIAYGATVQVISSRLSNNSTGGGISTVDGTLTIADSTISGNSASDGGGGIHTEDSTLSIANTIVTGNSTPDGLGGGIMIVATYGHTAEIVDSTVTGNSASQGGGIWSYGTVNVTDSTIAGNAATGGGGGLYAYAGSLDLARSTVRGNTAYEGGGIYNREAEVTLTGSTVDANSGIPGGGGGIINRHILTLIRTTVSRNLGQDAGGMMNFDGIATVTNSTISDNDAGTGDGGGIANAGALSITSSTISGNRCGGPGGGIENIGTVTLANTLVAGQSTGSDCHGTGITSYGYNLDSDGTCGLDQPTDQPNTAALLGPLQDNGGPTETRALLEGSPAIDQGSCPGETADQRGVPRPVDIVHIPNAADGCDVGAFELPMPLPIEADVDIKPGSTSNPINLENRGGIPVAILTNDALDATTVDPLSVRFGPAEAVASHDRGHTRDVDHDGDLDLVLHFATQETGIQCGATSATLVGMTFGGQPIEGSDSVRTLGCR